jgi:hypothetical protein
VPIIPTAIDSATIALIRKLLEREGDAEEADLDTISLFACSSQKDSGSRMSSTINLIEGSRPGLPIRL